MSETRSRPRSGSAVAESYVSPVDQLLRKRPWESNPPPPMPGGGPPVLFSVRCNVWYRGKLDDDTPTFGFGVSFNANDFVQVIQVVNQHWWIGRVIGHGPKCGYIPSPARFRATFAGEHLGRKDRKPKKPADGKSVGSDSTTATSGNNVASLASLFNHTTRPKGEESFITSMESPDDEPYSLAPLVRPVVFLGPSLPGCELTDTMQRALTGYLVKCIGDKLQYLPSVKTNPVGRSVSTARPSARHASVGRRPSASGRKSKMSAGVWNSPNAVDIMPPSVRKQMSDLAGEGKITVVDVSGPDVMELKQSITMPILIRIKISNLEVLGKLLKVPSQGEPDSVSSTLSQAFANFKDFLGIAGSRKENKLVNDQLIYSERLNSIDDTLFDLTLSNSKLNITCYEVTAFVDAYLGEVFMPAEVDPRIAVN